MAGTGREKESTEKTLRVFIAFRLPAELRGLLQQVQSELKKADLPVKWVRPENIHLTVKFLGDVNPPALEKIASAMQAAAASSAPLTLSACGLGVFPGVKKPRVIWCGLGGDVEALARLHSSLDEALAELGFEREAKKFRAHLTLGRIKGRVDPETMIDLLSRHGHMASDPFACDRLCLYQSRLKPAGPVYSRLAEAPLAG